MSFCLSVHKTSAGPQFLIDTIKAPFHSLELAFKTVANAKPSGRKRIVFGTISDYSGTRKKIYLKAARQALEAADEVIFVSDGAGGVPNAKTLDPKGQFTVFYSTREAADYIRQTSHKDDLILLKGSSNLHLERIFLQYIQDQKCWETKCGKTENCISCGLSQVPFSDHRTYKRSNNRKNNQLPDWYQH